MSADIDRQQAKMKEFMSLLPLTLELAGLPRADPGRAGLARTELGTLFTDAQMEARVQAVKVAYKLARQLVIDVSRPADAGT